MSPPLRLEVSRLVTVHRLLFRWTCAVLIGALLGSGLLGCAGARESEGNGESSASEAPSDGQQEGLQLIEPTDEVRTIQLYEGSNEQRLPIVSLGSGNGTLTLEFDLMASQGRPLSVYFYHADRSWRRDLSPAQYLSSFQNDNLLDYRPSRGTLIPYVHYEYQFPNEDIDFRVSGNYVIRVTEQGRENEVLFERAFFVSEQAGPVQLGIEDVVVSGQRQPSDIPIARFTPPSQLRGDPFSYDVCFVRNAQFAQARCSERPRLARMPDLEFDLLRERAFAPTTARYFLDLSSLRVGGSIESTDRTASPYRIMLRPDYARFANTPLAPDLNGQTLVGSVVRSVGEPDVEAEYVTTAFRFVPPNEQPFSREVVVAGSFTGGRYNDDYRLRWVADRGRYEGEVLLKQGHYEYFYDSPDPALRQAVRQSLPRMRERYTAFVYYDDPTLNTDRLIAVQSVQSQ